MEIYTDGSCDNRAPVGQKHGGWAFAVAQPQNPKKWYLFYGYLAADSTNNIAELYGFRNAVMFTSKTSGHRVIHCDSQYVGYPVKNRAKWEATGLDGRKNIELIKDMWLHMDNARPTYEHKWVKGHAGIVGNEVADRGAEWGANRVENPDLSELKLTYGVEVVPNYFATPDAFDDYLRSHKLLSE